MGETRVWPSLKLGESLCFSTSLGDSSALRVSSLMWKTWWQEHSFNDDFLAICHTLQHLPSLSAFCYWRSRGKWNSRIRKALAEQRDGSLPRWSTASARVFLLSASWISSRVALLNCYVFGWDHVINSGRKL